MPRKCSGGAPFGSPHPVHVRRRPWGNVIAARGEAVRGWSAESPDPPPRSAFGTANHFAVFLAVLVQEGINADSAGVMITTDPFDPRDEGAVYLNAKKGLGIRVVEGQKVPKSDSVQVLTRSAEDCLLTFDEKGGIKELPAFPNRAVLTDALARRLAHAAQAVKRAFGGVDQDLEWLTVGEQVYLVQTRLYVCGSR